MTERGSSYPSSKDIREQESQGDLVAREERKKGMKEGHFITPDEKEENLPPPGEKAA